jgi:hypothetical protein
MAAALAVQIPDRSKHNACASMGLKIVNFTDDQLGFQAGG